MSDLSIAALQAASEHHERAKGTLWMNPDKAGALDAPNDDALAASILEHKKAHANLLAALAYAIDFYSDLWGGDEEALGELIGEMMELRFALVELVRDLDGRWTPPEVLPADPGDELAAAVPEVRVPYSPPAQHGGDGAA